MDDVSYFDELPDLLNRKTSNDMDFDTCTLPMFDPNNYSPDFQFGMNINHFDSHSPIYDLNNNTNNNPLLTLPQLSPPPPPLPPIDFIANSQTQINLQFHTQSELELELELQQRNDIGNLNRFYSSLRFVDYNDHNNYYQQPRAQHAFLYNINHQNIQNIDEQLNSNSIQPVPFHKSNFYIDNYNDPLLQINHNKPETQNTKKTDEKPVKTEKQCKKSTAKKTKKRKRKRKRKRKEMDDDDCADNDNYNINIPSKKRQKTDISDVDISQYIMETMSKNEANKLFNNMVSNGEVVFSEKKNENYCYVNECNKSFGAKCHLKRHCLESHIGRRFKCIYPQCSNNMQFKQKSQCKEHIMNTHGNGASDKQWKCYICPDTFTRWNGVKRHLILVRCKILKNNYSKAEIKNVVENVKAGKCKDICKNY